MKKAKNNVDAILYWSIPKTEMSAIIVETPLEHLPQHTVETLKNEAIRRGIPIDELIAEGAISLAQEIDSHRKQPSKKGKS